MKIDIGDLSLFVDIDGFGLVPDGPRLRQRPTLVLVHGGPGFDHATQKSYASRLAEFAQVICYDQRGHGRSDRGSPSDWTLAQWADDIPRLCQALGIERPIVMGSSFGGIVAQAYALRHPDHPAGLILHSTTARFSLERVARKFEQLGGAQARQIAEAVWRNPGDPQLLEPYRQVCMPLYNTKRRDPGAMRHWGIDTPAVLSHFFSWGAEGHRFDFRSQLQAITCPTLVLSGTEDPICPIEDAEDIAAALPAQRVDFRRFPGCGHGVNWDDLEGFVSAIREFVAP